MQGSSKARKITNGFLLSVAAGVLVLLNGVFWLIVAGRLFTFNVTPILESASGDPTISTILLLPFIILGSIGILFAIGIFIGATFIYLYRNESTGGKIVIAFSVLSIATGGGLIIGMIIGIIGGAYGIYKK